MRASADTFLAFVDQLARRLDDHDLDGDGLASGAYLSRYHFDRVIRTTAGEAPNQFRRRVLLKGRHIVWLPARMGSSGSQSTLDIPRTRPSPGPFVEPTE